MADVLTAAAAEWSAIRWGAVSTSAVTAAAVAALDLWAVPDGPGSGLTWLVAATLAGAVALALDAPAAELTAPSPVSLRFRAGARLLLVLPTLGVWAAYGAVVVGQRSPGPVWWAVALVGAGLTLTAAAAGAVLQRAAHPEPGGPVASVVLLGVVALMVLPLPEGLQPFDVSGERTWSTTLWSGAGGVAVILLWWATADPWHRAPGLSPPRAPGGRPGSAGRCAAGTRRTAGRPPRSAPTRSRAPRRR